MYVTNIYGFVVDNGRAGRCGSETFQPRSQMWKVIMKNWRSYASQFFSFLDSPVEIYVDVIYRIVRLTSIFINVLEIPQIKITELVLEFFPSPGLLCYGSHLTDSTFDCSRGLADAFKSRARKCTESIKFFNNAIYRVATSRSRWHVEMRVGKKLHINIFSLEHALLVIRQRVCIHIDLI